MGEEGKQEGHDMKVFQYIVFYEPRPKLDSDEARIVVPLTEIVAKDLEKATLIAARSIPDRYVPMIDQLTVVVRPF